MAFKLENGNVAPALYFGGSVLATEQFSIIRDKRHRTVHSDKKKRKKREKEKAPMIAGLPVCHPPTKSSPSRPTTVLSDLIMSRIRSPEEPAQRVPQHTPPRSDFTTENNYWYRYFIYTHTHIVNIFYSNCVSFGQHWFTPQPKGITHNNNVILSHYGFK